jgi:ABC-type uncharacterized transport system substrate-binding protein
VAQEKRDRVSYTGEKKGRREVITSTKSADLPVEQPTRFELIINLKEAKAIGLTILVRVIARGRIEY